VVRAIGLAIGLSHGLPLNSPPASLFERPPTYSHPSTLALAQPTMAMANSGQDPFAWPARFSSPLVLRLTTPPQRPYSLVTASPTRLRSVLLLPLVSPLHSFACLHIPTPL
jgi:hypothetical protein